MAADEPQILWKQEIVGAHASGATTIAVDDLSALSSFPISLCMYDTQYGSVIAAVAEGAFEIIRPTGKSGNNLTTVGRNAEGGFGAVTILEDETWEIFWTPTPLFYTQWASLSGDSAQDFAAKDLTVHDSALITSINEKQIEYFRTGLDPDIARWGYFIASNGRLILRRQNDDGTILGNSIVYNRDGSINLVEGMYQLAGVDIIEMNSFNPTFEPESGAFGTLVYTTREGFYAILTDGTTEWMDLYILLSTNNVSFGTASGALRIGNIPDIGNGTLSVGHMLRFDFSSAPEMLTPRMRNTNYIQLLQYAPNGVNEIITQVSDMLESSTSNRNIIELSGRVKIS